VVSQTARHDLMEREELALLEKSRQAMRLRFMP